MSSASDPEELVEPSGSPSAVPPGQHQGTAWDDAAAAWIKEEKDSLAFSDEEEIKLLPHTSSEKTKDKASIFSALNFPEKLYDWLKATNLR